MIPMLAIIKIHRENQRSLRLWIPLILIWILLLPVAVFVVPILLIAALIFLRHPFQAIAAFWNMLCALRGLRIHVVDPENNVYVSIH